MSYVEMYFIYIIINNIYIYFKLLVFVASARDLFT